VATDAIQLGAGLCFGYAFGESIIPSITVGAAYLNFSPKNTDGHVLLYNSLDKYNKGIVNFMVEGELKIKISDRFSINTILTYHPTSTDYIEDVSAATNNDTYLTGMLGVSYAISGNFDSDGDGIKDNIDLCMDAAEDIDGFEDADGCPDPDNDKDGILDINDKCPDQPEDKDGFEDLDGCPDSDNDLDGIFDINDKCPNDAEDMDGFLDEDGCPDSDNDDDGILDINDKCPNEPETKNNFEDEDGCPDNVTQQETFYQFNLRGEDTFNNSSSNLKETTKLILNEIAFYIQNQPNSKWRVEGHMDSQGSVYTIKKLSYDRAKAVFDYLVSQGVNANQLEVYGLGDSFPIGNNNTAEGRNANRRIMIIRED
jgi:outer membrane protein OmpA-like peptidoglycan-associated protein